MSPLPFSLGRRYKILGFPCGHSEPRVCLIVWLFQILTTLSRSSCKRLINENLMHFLETRNKICMWGSKLTLVNRVCTLFQKQICSTFPELRYIFLEVSQARILSGQWLHEQRLCSLNKLYNATHNWDSKNHTCMVKAELTDLQDLQSFSWISWTHMNPGLR